MISVRNQCNYMGQEMWQINIEKTEYILQIIEILIIFTINTGV